jgi:hypothetical protein
MKTIKVKHAYNYATESEWVYPDGEHATALFKFVTGGTIGVPCHVWCSEIEPVLKALGWWWTL